MIRLIKNQVAVTPIFDPDQSPGGIWIPDMAKERCDQGIVKYIGPDVQDIGVGMYVLFSGYTGTLVHIAGEGPLIIMTEPFIVCQLPEVDNIHIPGLYFKNNQGQYFKATYEEIINFIADAFKYSEHMKNIKVNVPKPRYNEKNEMEPV